jgi:hypothetical protein
MVLAGLALGSLVFVSWPEPTTQVVRLPYGESAPKTPHERAGASRVVQAKPAAPVVPSVEEVVPEQAPAVEEEGRVLAAVEPAQSRFAGPAPIPSKLELQPGYVRESPESLGAKPLPGAVLTPGPPPVAR